jgi:hypothetical protein
MATATSLTKYSLEKLGQFQSKTQRIGIEHHKDSSGKEWGKIVLIEKADYTPLNRFKSYFGCGPLGNADFRLSEVTRFLVTADIASLNVEGSSDNVGYQAYLTAATLANKLFHLTQDATPMRKLSKEPMLPFKSCMADSWAVVQKKFLYNPAMTTREFREALGLEYGFFNLSEFEIKSQESHSATESLVDDQEVLTSDLIDKIRVFLSDTTIQLMMTHYDPKTERIGFRKNDPFSSPVILKKSDFTWWNRLLGHLGYGKLAGIDYSLQSVVKYLKRHEWKKLDDPSTQDIYRTVFNLAIKALHSKNASTHAKAWLDDMTKVRIQKNVNTERKEGSSVISQIETTSYKLPWYETMRVKDIQKFLGGNSATLYVNGQPLDPDTLITQEQLEKASITVTH